LADIGLLILAPAVAAFVLAFVTLNKEISRRKNFGPELAVKTSVELIDRTERTLKIVTTFSPELFDDNKVLSALKDATERNVEVHILYYPELDQKEATKLSHIIQSTKSTLIESRLLRDEPPYHFWLADERHLRLEKPHPPKDISNVHGEIIYNTLKLGTIYEGKFEALWAKTPQTPQLTQTQLAQ
jgi:phosphatidylserine/phosphatidylglycerophosphate/cardiolipin synthase-like enzyme